MRSKIMLVPLISALILTFASCGQKYFTVDGKTWGTTYHIVYKSNDNLDAEIAESLAATDATLSMFNPSSEVSAVNAGRTDSVSESFSEVFGIASTVSKWSNGAYDPTIAPLTDLWGFGRTDTGTLPPDSAIAIALATVGIDGCHITDGHIHKKSSATAFDFSSIAKGYGIDCIGRIFDDRGITDYMIEIGGEVLARGISPKGRPWRIQIDAPESSLNHSRLAVVNLGPDRTALASSGNYRNYRCDSLGNIYGHTLSPLTGRPVKGTVLAASVIAPDCALADALATACMANGNPENALSTIENASADVLLVIAEADSLVTITGGDFKKYFTK